MLTILSGLTSGSVTGSRLFIYFFFPFATYKVVLIKDYFPHAELVRDLENSIHEIINESLVKMTANADINTKEEMEGMSKTMKLKVIC